MKTFTLFWLTGDYEIIKGESISDAFRRSGYGGGALRALDFHAEGDIRNEYEYINGRWTKKQP